MSDTINPATEALVPYLAVHDAAAAIDFYVAAFGAVEAFRVTGDDGRVGHAELTIGSQRLLLSDEYPDFGAVSPRSLGGTAVTLHLSVGDCDGVHDAAVTGGATSDRGPADQTHGSRTATITDPFGHRWMLSQTIEEIDVATYAEREGGGFTVEPAAPTATGADVGIDRVWASLNCVDAPAMITLLVEVFGFTESVVVRNPGDESVIEHSELQWSDGGGIMLGSAGRSGNPHAERATGTASVYLSSRRVDDLWQRCLDADLEVVDPLTDHDYGSHGFGVRDHEGNVWTIGTYRGE